MGEALPVPWLHKQWSHVKAWDRDHKSSWLNQVPAPRSCGTASCCGKAGGSHRPLRGWRSVAGTGRRQQRAGEGSSFPALPSRAAASRSLLLQPAAAAARIPVLTPGSHGSATPGLGGRRGNLRLQPPRTRLGNAVPLLPETLRVTRDAKESRAKSPQPLGAPRAAGRGSRGPGELPPAGEGGKGNPAGCAPPLRDGRERPRPRRDGLRQQPRGGGSERRTYLRPDGRHAAGGAESRGRAAAAALYLRGGRRAAPPPATPAGPGRLRAPPRLSQQRGPDGRSRTEPSRAERSRARLLPRSPAPRGSAALARDTDSRKPAAEHGCRAGGVLGGGGASRRAVASPCPVSPRVAGCRRARGVPERFVVRRRCRAWGRGEAAPARPARAAPGASPGL